MSATEPPGSSAQPAQPLIAADAILLTSRRNPLVAQLRALHTPRGRKEQGLLLLEGTHLLQETLRLQLLPELLLATPAWIARHGGLLTATPMAGALRARLRLCSPEVLAAAASTRSPDGVLLTLAAAEPRLPPRPGFVLALDRLQDPGNLGTLLRTALAAGVEAVWLADGADPWQPKVLRASSGAALALPLERLDGAGLRARLQAAPALGLQRLAAVVQGEGGAPPYWQLDWTRPTVLLLGHEGGGLAPELLALADRCVTIPHAPAVESLNVAVAAAPLLLERWRQRWHPPDRGECPPMRSRPR